MQRFQSRYVLKLRRVVCKSIDVPGCEMFSLVLVSNPLGTIARPNVYLMLSHIAQLSGAFIVSQNPRLVMVNIAWFRRKAS